MILEDAQRLAEMLMAEHGLTAAGWTFGFSNATRAAGSCQERSYNATSGTVKTVKRIKLSRHFVSAADSALVRETILHEIAHALVGPVEGHGPRWQTKVLELGGSSDRTCLIDLDIPGKWVGTCPGCGHVWQLYRAPKGNKECRACALGGRPCVLTWSKRRPDGTLEPAQVERKSHPKWFAECSTKDCVNNNGGSVLTRSRAPRRLPHCEWCGLELLWWRWVAGVSEPMIPREHDGTVVEWNRLDDLVP